MNDTEEKGLVPSEESALGRIVITEAQVQLIKNTVAVGATDDELKLFFFECRRRGVHPMDRLIHFVKRGSGNEAKATFQAGIDFMRSQAEGTGEYRGQDDIEYGPMFAVNETVAAPTWAKATVKRRDRETGEIVTTAATAFWDEFYPGDKLGFMWRKMPRVMLGKCAESQALRKAFPRQLAGLYSFEEMEQADIVQQPDRPPIQKPQAKQETPKEPASSTTGDKPEPDGPYITEAQAKRFWAIAKASDRTDEQIHVWLKDHYGINSTVKIPKAMYDKICTNVSAREPGSEG